MRQLLFRLPLKVLCSQLTFKDRQPVGLDLLIQGKSMTSVYIDLHGGNESSKPLKTVKWKLLCFFYLLCN